MKSRDTKKIKKVREYFLENPNKTIYEIAEDLGICKSEVSECLSHVDYYLVPSLNTENTYFLFGAVNEKKLITNYEKIVENAYDFNTREKDFIRGYGFKFN